MSVPREVSEHIESSLGKVADVRPVTGGDTSQAVHVSLGSGEQLFVKWSNGAAGDTYRAEVDGLQALGQHVPDAIHVPEVLLYRIREGPRPGFLVLPWLEPGAPDASQATSFGESLALLHQAGSEAVPRAYGWDRSNYLGPEAQVNDWAEDWTVFWGQRRLLAMAGRMRDRNRWLVQWDGWLESLVQRLSGLLPQKPTASPLHGDLWGGNVLALADGRTALIDPAFYYGHAEVDLALTKLFGGFRAEVYEAYHHLRPTVGGFAERREIYQLYYLMMHLGISMSYGEQVGRILRRYGE